LLSGKAFGSHGSCHVSQQSEKFLVIQVCEVHNTGGKPSRNLVKGGKAKLFNLSLQVSEWPQASRNA
jgi:hypothetical protein